MVRGVFNRVWSDEFQVKLTFFSLMVLSCCSFISFSLTALSHILIFLPGLYFFLQAWKKSQLNITWELKFFIIFMFATFFSVFANWDSFDHPVKALFKIKYLLLGFLAIFAYRNSFANYINQKRQKLLIYSFIISTSVATLSGIVGLFSGFNPLRFKDACHAFRACGMYGMTITYGNGIALVSILIASLLFFYKDIKINLNKRLLWATLIINFAGLYLSYTRGSLLAFLAGVAMFLWYKNRKWFFAALIFPLSMIAILFYMILSGPIGESLPEGSTLNRYFAPLGQNSNLERVGLYQAAFYAVKDNPLWGVGFRNFEAKSASIKKKYQIIYSPEWKGHAHNNILEFFAGTGIIGGMAFLLWHLMWFWRGIRFFTPFFITFFVSGLFQSTIIDGENVFVIMGVYALSQVWVPPIDLEGGPL